MALVDFQIASREPLEAEEEVIPPPQISVIEAGESYGKFAIEPLESGFGVTLGNPLRRALYSSLKGTAVTWVKIEGVLHEYSTIPHAKEEVFEFLLNVKGVRLRSQVDRPGKLRLEVAGEGEVCAADIMASSDFEVVNPELHLLTLDSSEAKLSVEFNVEHGKGYVVASHDEGQPIGVLPVDAVYTPVRRVNYEIESTRVGQRTDFERLVLELWTDGSVTPVGAIVDAAKVLENQFHLVAMAGKRDPASTEPLAIIPNIPAEQYNIPVERLELSSRTLNCLKRATINKVGEVLEKNKAELLRIRNFGEKSYTELYARLRDMDLLPPELDPELAKNGAEDTTASGDGEEPELKHDAEE